MQERQDNQGNDISAAEQSAIDWWVFDVDGCLIDSLTGRSLRPGAKELLEELGRTSQVLLWSAGGEDYARTRSEQVGINGHVSDYFSKNGRDANGYYRVAHLPVDLGRAVFVDDRPEDLADNLEVLAVSPYLSDSQHDHALEIVARRAGLTWIENTSDTLNGCGDSPDPTGQGTFPLHLHALRSHRVGRAIDPL